MAKPTFPTRSIDEVHCSPSLPVARIDSIIIQSITRLQHCKHIWLPPSFQHPRNFISPAELFLLVWLDSGLGVIKVEPNKPRGIIRGIGWKRVANVCNTFLRDDDRPGLYPYCSSTAAYPPALLSRIIFLFCSIYLRHDLSTLTEDHCDKSRGIFSLSRDMTVIINCAFSLDITHSLVLQKRERSGTRWGCYYFLNLRNINFLKSSFKKQNINHFTIHFPVQYSSSFQLFFNDRGISFQQHSLYPRPSQSVSSSKINKRFSLQTTDGKTDR